jgi:lysophospholipid acyltransferase (LPLAT)-like uncharacterized protein
MTFKKLKQDLLRFLGNIILVSGLNLLCGSLRIKEKNRSTIDELEKSGKTFVLAFWHGTMLLPWYVYRNKKMAGLTSKSKDGDLLAKVLKGWNYKVVRGSSSHGGVVALGIMVDYVKNKNSLMITPDGPRGPEFKFKAGAVITAKKWYVPLFLAGAGFEKKRKLKSWDSFQIPKFFSRAQVVYSEPILIDASQTYEQTSEVINNCERMLNNLQAEAEIFN